MSDNKVYVIGDLFYEVKELDKLLPPAPANTKWVKTGVELESMPPQVEYRLEGI